MIIATIAANDDSSICMYAHSYSKYNSSHSNFLPTFANQHLSILSNHHKGCQPQKVHSPPLEPISVCLWQLFTLGNIALEHKQKLLFFLFLNTSPVFPYHLDHLSFFSFQMRTLETKDIKLAVKAGLRILYAFLELPKLICIPLEGKLNHTFPLVLHMGIYIASRSVSFFIMGLLVCRYPPPPFLLAYLFRRYHMEMGSVPMNCH